MLLNAPFRAVSTRAWAPFLQHALHRSSSDMKSKLRNFPHALTKFTSSGICMAPAPALPFARPQPEPGLRPSLNQHFDATGIITHDSSRVTLSVLSPGRGAAFWFELKRFLIFSGQKGVKRAPRPVLSQSGAIFSHRISIGWAFRSLLLSAVAWAVESETSILKKFDVRRPNGNFLFEFKLFIRTRNRHLERCIKNAATGKALTRRGTLSVRSQAIREQKKTQGRSGDLFRRNVRND